MAIINLAYVKARIRYRTLLELTDDAERPQGKIDDTKLQQAITDVEYKVNNALRKNYIIPLAQLNDESVAFADSSGMLQHLTLKCLMYTLYFQANLEVPEHFANAFVELEAYESGENILYGCQKVARNAVVSNKVAADKIYNSDLLSKI